MIEIVIDFKGPCPECGHNEFHLVDEFEETQWIQCEYGQASLTTENGELVEE